MLPTVGGQFFLIYQSKSSEHPGKRATKKITVSKMANQKGTYCIFQQLHHCYPTLSCFVHYIH